MKYRTDVKYYSKNGRLNSIKDFPTYIAEKSGLVYEVIRVKNTKTLFLNEHLIRLNKSLSKIGFENISLTNLDRYIQDLIYENKIENGNLKLAIELSKNNSNVFLYFIPHRYPTKLQIVKGVIAKLQFDSRENPSVKISNWDIRGKSNKIIDTEKVYETILVNKNNEITEGSRSNIFFIKGNQLYTADSEYVLPGITRQKVIELSAKLNIRIIYKNVNINDLAIYEAGFLTGTSPGLLQISRISDYKFGINNYIYNMLYKEYEKLLDC